MPPASELVRTYLAAVEAHDLDQASALPADGFQMTFPGGVVFQTLEELIAGSRDSYIATLVERRTHYVMLAKVKNKITESVVAALTKQVQHLPRELRRSLTWDRGKELADHRRLTLATNLDIYFCDPHNPWQRGTNENTSRLLRQYFPKGTNLSLHNQAQLNAVVRELNERPRKTLNYHSPVEKFEECVAAID